MLGLTLWFTLTFGLQDSVKIIDSHLFQQAPIYAEIELHASNDFIDLYGIYRNEMDKIHSIYFSPVTDYFTVGVELNIDAISVKIEHQCFHPLIIYGHKNTQYEGSYNKIEFTIKSN